jgi:DNA segregation ATPase FtsK/SpoIIIE-like protein
MGTMAKNSFRAFAALSLSLVLGLARAQDGDSYDPDPPDRAARLSYLSGDVSMQPAGEQDWAPAIINRPLTTGDKLWTERDARAEIYVGPASVRLDGNTGFSFLNVDDDTIQMRMTAGVIYVNVRSLDGNDHVEIDTPNIAVSVLRPGNYRVEVNDAGDATTVKISEGEAEIDGPGQNVVVHAQQKATFRGDDNLVADWGSLGSPDEFDRWNLERDRRDERSASSRTAQYVSPDVTGYQDLDDNGSWASEPEYGYVWTPSRVAVDWSPYRYGRWVWVSPWGWTWIDDAPWGYAPFHYGRWAHVRDRWCWVPGPRHVRAVYAPALVGWVGSPGLSVSVSVGSGVGWFPLGPREVYVPGRRFSHRYVERVNVTNTVIVNRTVINNVYVNGGRNVDYRNRHVPGGFTAVSRETFVNAGHTGDRRVRLDDRDLARASVSTAPQFQPGRESRLGGAVRPDVRVPPRAVADRRVVVRREPPATNARFMRERPIDRVPPEQRDAGVVDRNRPDRSGRSQPQPQPVQPSNNTQGVPEQRTYSTDRNRDDRPPKERNTRGDDRSFQREMDARRQQQADDRQRSQRNDDQQREQQQRDQQVRDSREQQRRQQQERDSRDQLQRQQQERDSRDQLQRQQQEREARDQQQRQMQQQQDAARQAATRRQQTDEQAVEARMRNEERQRDSQRQQQQQQERQQQERQQQQQRQQQDRQREQPRQREAPKQDDKPRRPRNDDDNPKTHQQ